MDPLLLLLLFVPDFSVLEVELVLDAGDERFCEAVDDVVVCLPCGEVLTDRGDVSPVAFEVIVTLLPAWVLESGGVLLVGGPVVLRSWGDDTPVDDVESAYLQLAAGFSMPGLWAPGLAWCK